MNCPICGYELDTSVKFCTNCGKKIPRCPTCGEVLYERSRFCTKDGTPLPPELFADLPADGRTERLVSAGISAAVTEILENGAQPAAKPPVRPAPPPPPSRPAPRPEPPEKKKKGIAVAVAVVVLLLVLAAAVAFGTYYVLEHGLPFQNRGEDVSSSEEDSSREDTSAGEDETDSEDKAIQKALDQADVHASAGEYHNALTVIQDALEEYPNSRKLKNALEEYEDLCVTAVMEEVDRLIGEKRFDEAQNALDAGLALVPAHTDLLDKTRELENAIALADNTPPVTMAGITSITSSSFLSEPNLNLYHTPERTVDGSLSTAWVEGLDGHGIGEFILFEFDRAYLVSGIRINAGYQKSAELYTMNNRPAALTVTFSDGTEQTVALQDVNSLHEIPFLLPVETDSIRLSIASVYPGTTYMDTVISEISFY